jgi:hypothetical protein
MKVSGLDYRFSPPHQKQGGSSSRCPSLMRSVPHLRDTPRIRLSRMLPRVGTLLVLLAVVGVLAASPARAANWGQAVDPYAWSNGSVTCAFSSTLPSVTVSATGLNGTGMEAALDQVNEISPSGATIATGVVSGATWNPQNSSSTEWFVLNYTEQVTIVNATLPTQTLGLAWFTIQFALERAPPNATQADQVALQISVQGWPWQSPTDTLALVVPLWSAFPTSEHVVVASSTSPRVESVRTSNGQPLEYFEAGTSATTGTGVAVPVTSQTTVQAGIATTTLTLGRGAGGATQLTYQATMGITPSTRVLGIPLYDYAAVAGGAALVALVVGIGTRRVRSHPSDLTYVEEEV